MAAQDGSRRASVRPVTACTECQRRKQKASSECNREWPCSHCQTRRIAHLCKFTPKKAVRAANSASSDTRVPGEPPKHLNLPNVGPKSTNASNYDDLRLLGYLPDHQISPNEGAGTEPTAVLSGSQDILSSEMENALRAIPPKPYTDILVQHFLDNTNYQYYCLYPHAFMHDYASWWSGKANRLPLTSEFTCLLLRLCACSAPYLDEELRQKLELELGESMEDLSLLCHNTAKKLSSTIPPGKGGLTQVQQLFLTAQWFKTEALFVESWHALSTTIHEAQELGMHRSSSSAKFSDFDREMRRRLWCILYAWDWQMSLLLSRPFIINSSCCSFEMPNMQLETVDSEPESPSPITHMVLQCQLGLSISKLPGVMGGVLSSTQAMSIQQETEKWFESFPSAYSITGPDTRWDNSHQFVKLQRFQLYVIGYMMMLLPLKQSLTKHIDPDSSSIEKGLQTTAVDNALKLLTACDDLLKHILPLNVKFYFAPFLMFDTAALLCSAIMHDKERSLPQREKVLKAIPKTLDELGQLSERAKTGMICYRALKKLVTCLPLRSVETASTDSKTPQSTIGAPPTLPDQPVIPDLSSCFPATTSPINGFHNGFSAPTSLNLFPSDMDGYSGLADLPNVDLGELEQIWDWENLEIDFLDMNSPDFYPTSSI
ncbi:fungal-specific transcription factor domain-containing protein [Aspergillus cavernicola]|uniref:Fungal-specific transcription factor domain-containing protein n=1 Tax=Aspergillus cavernicola TaxID=176166 RepID=A0ABR4INL4_9EURO